MNWLHFKLCFVVVFVLTPYFVDAQDSVRTHPNGEEELIPFEQTMDVNDMSIMFNQPARKVLRQSLPTNFVQNSAPNTGYQFGYGRFPAPHIGQPLDAQASSAYNKVLLVLNNDKNKFTELAKMAEEPLKRLTRNPDVMDDIVGQFQQLSGGMLQQVSQSAPDMSKSFGQALNQALAQTNLLVQSAPPTFDLSQLTQSVTNLPANLDFGQLGQSLGQSIIAGATQGLLNPAVSPAATDAAADPAVADASPDSSVDDAPSDPPPEPQPESEPAPIPANQPTNPLDQIVGSALIPPFGLNLPPSLPFNMFAPLPSWNPLMPLGSEISEVRALPEPYSPYTIAPKPVDYQTMAEMKLKAVLKDALTKKTIPILWFHLPPNQNVQKTKEDLEIEAKLSMFEKQVIAELKQLQELSKLANEVKIAQLESGVQPSDKLKNKLRLHEIPIYDITLGDIEKTLKDEHVIMLMHTIVQKHNKEFTRHQQATTKYLTDLTGTPIKRQTKTAEDALKTMEKDDMLKMMTYAYRMAAMNGHDMPWLQKAKEETTTSNMPVNTEEQWLADKQQQMAKEVEKQRQMMDEEKQKAIQNQERNFSDSTHMQQQPMERQWANPGMMQQKMPGQMMAPHMQQQRIPYGRQMMPPQMQQQQIPSERQMMPPQMQQQQIPSERQMMLPQMQQQQIPPEIQMMRSPMQQHQQMPFQRQMIPSQMPQTMPTMIDSNRQMSQTDIQRQRMPQPMMMQPQMPMQMQWLDHPNSQQQQRMEPDMQPQQKQLLDINTQEAKAAIDEQKSEEGQSVESKTPKEPTDLKTESPPEQRQFNESTKDTQKLIDAKVTEQTATKPTMGQKDSSDTNTPLIGEAKPQVAENAEQARSKGMRDFFDDLNVFDHGRRRQKEGKTIINYYYNSGGSRYPPIYAAAGGYQAPSQSYQAPSQGYGGGYASQSSGYGSAPQYSQSAGGSYGGGAHGSNAYGSNSYGSNAYGSHGSGYRAATGDEEIAAMLQQHKTMPKLMMKMTPKTEEPNHPTDNDKNNAEDSIRHHSIRLAHTQTDSNTSPAAYVVVIRNKASKSSRSRRKRSTEFATLEPIDENSLNALRKTYKNSLKEITLNPNETPAEALMRYNAESIREALAKANKQPMDIEAGVEHEETNGQDKLANEVDEQQQQEQIPQQLSQGYALSDNAQYEPVTNVAHSSVNNGPYLTLPAVNVQQTPPLSVNYNQQDSFYDPSANQEGIFNNYISKYNAAPPLYSSNNKMQTQNSFSSMYNPLESVPYIEDYSINTQPYQIASPNTINSGGRMEKSMLYQRSYTQPQLSYNHLSSSPALSSINTMNKNLPYYYTSGNHITDYDKSKPIEYDNYIRELPPPKTHYTFSHIVDKNNHIDTYSPTTRQPKMEYNHVKPQETYENLIAVIKERLSQCCNECKDNILNGLDESLRHNHYGRGGKMKVLEINVKPYATFADKSNTLSYRKPSQEEDDHEYQQWLTEMSGKGYDKSYLTRQHQRQYLKDDKLNLHIIDDKEFGHEEEKIFNKNYQSYKRETIIPETEAKKELETEIVTDSIVPRINTNKLDEDERVYEDGEGEDEDEEEENENEEEDELEHYENRLELEKPTKQNINITIEKISPVNVEKESEIQQEKAKNDTSDTSRIDESQTFITTKVMETAESTTSSVYALRGQFRPHKSNPMPLALKQGKQFNNYKNVNKLGGSNFLLKLDDKKNSIDKDDKLEEILDILHDLSKHSKEKSRETSKEENTITTINSAPFTIMPATPTSSTTKPLTNPAINLHLTTNATTIVDKPKKLSRRRQRLSSKSRKLVKSSSSLETID